jgi:hypothetical protein
MPHFLYGRWWSDWKDIPNEKLVKEKSMVNLKVNIPRAVGDSYIWRDLNDEDIVGLLGFESDEH